MDAGFTWSGCRLTPTKGALRIVCCIPRHHMYGRCTKTRTARDHGMDVVRRMLNAWVVCGSSAASKEEHRELWAQ
eukprot:8109043-Prorocentrum_lima.AAC.1